MSNRCSDCHYPDFYMHEHLVGATSVKIKCANCGKIIETEFNPSLWRMFSIVFPPAPSEVQVSN